MSVNDDASTHRHEACDTNDHQQSASPPRATSHQVDMGWVRCKGGQERDIGRDNKGNEPTAGPNDMSFGPWYVFILSSSFYSLTISFIRTGVV